MRREHRHSGTLADDLQLVHRGRPLQVWRPAVACVLVRRRAANCRPVSSPGLRAGGITTVGGVLRKRQLAGFAAEDAYRFSLTS